MKVAAVAYQRFPELRFLLVRTTGGRFWIFPKGGRKRRERPYEAATREAMEEAGCLGFVQTQAFASFDYAKVGGRTSTVPAFLMEVSNPVSLLPPEHEERCPTWFSSNDAIAALREDRNENEANPLVRVIELAARLLGTP